MGDRSTQKMPPKKKDDKKGATGSKKKKWSKGKVREKLNNAVTFDQPTYDKMMKEQSASRMHASTGIQRFKFSRISQPPSGTDASSLPPTATPNKRLACDESMIFL